jgi:ComF family protein
MRDFCLPGLCAVCERGGCTAPICDECYDKLVLIENENACEACGKPIPHGSACGWCKGKGIPHFSKVVSLGMFKDPLKHLIHEMKYHRRWPLAEYLAERVIQHERATAVLEECDYLVPVPLHWRRQFSRGYNQAEVLAKRIGNLKKIPVIAPAKRARNTPTQTQMTSAEARVKNLADAFMLKNPWQIEGKRLLLIDDVTTTGATLRALARCLSAAKPKSMSAIVLATADPRGNHFQVI